MFLALETIQKLGDTVQGISAQFEITFAGVSRPISFVTSFDWKAIIATHPGIAGSKASTPAARLCYRCGFYGNDKTGNWWAAPLRWWRSAPAPGAAAAGGGVCSIPVYIAGIKPEYDVYDPAHGCARVLSNLLSQSWRYLLAHYPALAPKWIEGITSRGFPATVKLLESSINVDINAFKVWANGSYDETLLETMGDWWGPLANIPSWDAAEVAVALESVAEAVARSFRCIKLLYRLCWGKLDRGEDNFNTWWTARTGILCTMFAFNMTMNSSVHYVMNHLGEDVRTFPNILSLLAEGGERQNQRQNQHQRSLIASHVETANVSMTQDMQALEHCLAQAFLEAVEDVS